MSPLDRLAATPPSSRLTGSPTPPRQAPLRLILAATAVLVVGLPAVWLLARSDPQAKTVRPAPQAKTVRPAPAGRTPTPPATSTTPAAPPALVAVPPKTRHPAAEPAPPANPASGWYGDPPHHPHAPRPPAAPRQPAKPDTAWITAECARRFPADDRRRSYCEAILARLNP